MTPRPDVSALEAPRREGPPGGEAEASPGAVRRTARIWLRVLRRPTALASLIIVVGVVGMATFGPSLVTGDPIKPNIVYMLRPPGAQFPLGTDELGRDLLTRIVYGARPTFYAGVAAVAIGCVLGSFLGLVAGYFGKAVDGAIMLVVDVLLSFPYFLLVVVVVAALGPSLTTAMIAIGIWTAPYYTRVIRASTLELRVKPFVEAAIVSGESGFSILFRHILPNCLPQIIVLSTTYLSQAILLAAALSFLGLGAQPPEPEWGAMTAIGREHIFQ
ncbi:MAG TPA: ABC transporter permease, partial [Actinomycetota bacterium]|nr:ABC transporter permease [Actinomycetota bacterium]